MCTRYYMELSPELRPIIEAARRSSLTGRMVDKLGKALKTEGEVRPTDMVPVLAPDKSGRQTVYPMIWGFTFPGMERPIVNARVESADSRPSFRESWQRRRCVIPASWYYEWDHIQVKGKKKAGSKYAIQPVDAAVTWLAGLYRIETGYAGFRYPVFSVLTRNPSPELLKIHDRMPVILPEDAISRWISPELSHAEIRDIADHSLTEMVAEKCV